MLDGIRLHVKFGRERKIVIDLAACESPQVEVKPLEVKDEVIGNVFQTCSVYTISIKGIDRNPDSTYLLTASTCRSQSEHLYLLSKMIMSEQQALKQNE